MVDGLISNQVKCNATFDPVHGDLNGAPVRCPGGADTGDTCLSDAQITALKTIEHGARFNFTAGQRRDAYAGYNVWGATSARAITRRCSRP